MNGIILLILYLRKQYWRTLPYQTLKSSFSMYLNKEEAYISKNCNSIQLFTHTRAIRPA